MLTRITVGAILILAGFGVCLSSVRLYGESRWPSAEGRILASRVERDRSEFVIACDIAYHPSVAGSVESIERRVTVTSGGGLQGRYAEMKALAISDFASGSRRTVWYNPSDPDDVRLSRPGAAWFAPPLVYIAFVIFVCLFATIIPRIQSNNVMASWQGRIVVLPVLALFAAFGIGMTVCMSIPTLFEWHSMKRWPTVTGHIDQSWIDHSRRGGTRVAVVYSFHVGGQDYFGERHGLFEVYDNFTSKSATLSSMSPGSVVTVYYNPRDPSDAILDRRFGWSGLIVLFPLPFAAVGIGGLLWCRRQWPKRRTRP